jgi:hypothetical protein
VAVLAVPPSNMNVRLPTVPPARSLFIRLGHHGLLISRMSRSAPGRALDDYNTIIY